MKYCEKCGAEIPENAKFCAKCGQKTSTGKAETEGKEPEYRDAVPDKMSGLKSSKKVRKVIPLCVIAAAVLIVIAIVFGSMKKRVDVNDCIEVAFSGYETIGTASAELDYEKFEKAVRKAAGKKLAKDDLSIFASEEALYYLEEAVTIKVTPKESLKNGDKVEVTVECDSDVGKEYGIKLIGKTTTFEAKGLEEIKKVNPFENLAVTFEGTSPNLSVNVESNAKDEYLNNLDFQLDKSEGIKVGDTVTLSVETDNETAQSDGYLFTEMSKEYLCESADKYLESIDEIDEKTLEAMQKEVTDRLEGLAAENSEYITTGEWVYEGSYILNAKEDAYLWTNEHILYLVYSTDVSAVNGEFDTTKIYMPVNFNDVIILADGTTSYNTQKTRINNGERILDSSSAVVFGFENGASLYNDLIVTNKDDYTYTVSGNIEEFGK